MTSDRGHIRIPNPLLLLAISLATAVAAHAVPIVCEPIHDPEGVFERNQVILIGELHGTQEIPAFVGAAACHALAAHRSITVGLEIPSDENGRLDAFLASPGTAADRSALLGGPFWEAPMKDGRSSQAMLKLIETLRDWRATGATVRILAIDPGQPATAGATAHDASHAADGETRDQAMADRLAASIREHPADQFLVLTGNVHNRLQQGAPWDSKFEPMGYLLSRAVQHPHTLVALDVRYVGGQASFCTAPDDASCGPNTLAKKWNPTVERQAAGHERGVSLDRAADQPAYSGYFYFRARLTASEPAVPPVRALAASYPTNSTFR